MGSSVQIAQESAVAEAVADVKTRKITVGLPEQLIKDLVALSKSTSTTSTSLIRFGLTLAKLYFSEKNKGNYLFVGDNNGKALMRIVFPE